MRTKEEILKEFEDKKTEALFDKDELVLEVLLDIRDHLRTPDILKDIG